MTLSCNLADKKVLSFLKSQGIISSVLDQRDMSRDRFREKSKDLTGRRRF